MPSGDIEHQVDDALIEKLKSRDERWRQVETAIKLEEELRGSIGLQIILQVLQEEAESSLKELQTVDPTDAKKIASLQERVKCVRVIGNTLESVRQKGIFLQRELEQEGRIALEETGEDHGGTER